MKDGKWPCSTAARAIDEVDVVILDEPGSPFGSIETWGMCASGLPEIEVRAVRQFLLPHAADIVRRIAAYMLESEPIEPGETVRIGPNNFVQLVPVASESGRSVATLMLVEAPKPRTRWAEGGDHDLESARGFDPDLN